MSTPIARDPRSVLLVVLILALCAGGVPGGSRGLVAQTPPEGDPPVPVPPVDPAEDPGDEAGEGTEPDEERPDPVPGNGEETDASESPAEGDASEDPATGTETEEDRPRDAGVVEGPGIPVVNPRAQETEEAATRRGAVGTLVENLRGTPLELVEVIERLRARYGVFGDLDDDGDLDYVATEMLQGREGLTTHIREPDGWRFRSHTTTPFRGKHPLPPWILPAYERNDPAVVLPVGWAPYIYVIPTDGQGRLRSRRSIALDRYLPGRISSSMGVDNVPYSIVRIEPPAKDRPPAIVGLIEDFSGGQERLGSFAISVDGRRVTRREGPVPADHWSNHINWRDDDLAIGQPAVDPGDVVDPEAARLRKLVIKRRPLDIDGDGIRDQLQLTADFAWHVYRGFRDARTGEIRYAAETKTPRGLPLRIVLDELWGGLPLEEILADPIGWFDLLGYGVREAPGTAVPVSITSSFATAVLFYTWDGHRLLTHLRRPEYIPRDGNGQPLWAPTAFDDRDQITDDFDGDGVPEILTVVTVAAGREVDRRRPERHPLVLYWRTEVAPTAQSPPIVPEEPATLLLEFPERVEEPDDPTEGRPLNLQRVRISGTDRTRACIYFRPWRAGFFLEASRKVD